jgi:hypothetical protein
VTSSPWAEIASWVLLPAAAWLLSAGVGLGAERLLRTTLPDALIAPSGFAATLLVALSCHELHVGMVAALAIVLVAALAGLGVALRAAGASALRRATGGWGGAAALATFVLFLSPVLLSGGWTWLGYNFLNDTAIQMLLADWIVHGGHAYAYAHTSSISMQIDSNVGAHYPLGAHAQLAMFSVLLQTSVAVLYQAYISLLAAIAAMAAFALLRTWLSPVLAGAGAVIALSANLTFAYALQGGIKEVAMASMLLVAAALGAAVLAKARPAGIAVLTGVGMAACLAVFSAAALPFIGVLGAGLVIALFMSPSPHLAGRGRWIVLGAAGAALTVAALPELSAITGFAHTVSAVYADPAAQASRLGQLQQPLPIWQALGVWFSGEYAFPLSGTALTLTRLVAAAIVLLVAVGARVSIQQRRPGALLVVVAVAVAWAYIAHTTTPYVEAKALAIAGPALLLLAVVGLTAFSRGLRVAGAIVAATVGGAILLSDAMAVHHARLGPTARMLDLQRIGDHYRGRGLLMFSEYEEFDEYFARNAGVAPVSESVTPIGIVLRTPVPAPGHTFDLDQETLPFVERFGLIVSRRSPSASRPPANYALDYRTTSYDVYRRMPQPHVLVHLPLGDPLRAAGLPRCAAVRRMLARAPAGTRLVGARTPEQAVFDITAPGAASPGWVPDPFAPPQLSPRTPGRAIASLRLHGGRYDAWVQGSLGRPLSVLVDGHLVGRARGLNTPLGWLAAGRVTLPAGMHTLELLRGGGSLRPGDGARSSVGAVSLRAPGDPVLVDAGRHARRLCHRPWDWIEAVR